MKLFKLEQRNDTFVNYTFQNVTKNFYSIETFVIVSNNIEVNEEPNATDKENISLCRLIRRVRRILLLKFVLMSKVSNESNEWKEMKI